MLYRRLSLYRLLGWEAESKENDLEINKILADMRKEFNIPTKTEDLLKWEENTIDAGIILECYREIKAMRFINDGENACNFNRGNHRRTM